MSNKKQKLVPELRFPEFEKDAEWKGKTIGELVKDNILFPQKDGNHGNIHPKSSDFVNKGIPFIMASDIRNGKINYSKCKHISKKQADNLQKGFAKEEDVLLTHKGTVGEVAIIRKNEFPYLMLTPQVTYYRIKKKDELSNEFLRSFFLCDGFQKKILDASGGGTRAYVGITAQGKLSITLPPTLLEQQKIANCLSSLDNLITAETEKLAHLKDHKKGLLQQLFPVNGETKPSFRFPEFENDGDWEERIIGKACEKPFSGGTPKSNNTEYYGGEIPFIRSAEINKENTKLYLTILGFKNSSAKMVEKGDVLVAMYGANSGDVGISKINGAINQAILCLRSKSNNHFLYQYLIHKKDWIIKKYLQGGQGNLSGDIVKSVQLLFPSLQEQQKIANCLSSVDELTETQKIKNAALKDHKKGLMQQLFPNQKELTI
jgi:type I restriction enzyme S subunit